MPPAFRRPHWPRPESERVPALRLISDYPKYWATARPGTEAVVFEDNRWSYAELADRIDACARGLLAQGIRPGDRVATLSPPHPDYYVTFVATISIGAIWLGLNPRYQIRELEYVANDASPRLVFARSTIGDRLYHEELAALTAACPSIERTVLLDDGTSYPGFITGGQPISNQELAVARAAVDPRAACLIVYTSGTTGKPKGALIHQAGLIKVARVQHAIWPVEPARVINNLPINHIGCIGDITCDTLVPGGTLVFQEQFDPGAMLDLVARERITFFGHVPTALQLIVSHPKFATTDFSTVQIIIWEGAAAPAELIERLRTRCGELANAYGMTETVGSVPFTFDTESAEVLANSVGWPVPEYDLRIAGPDGTPVASGEPGEVQVRGDFVTLGYWNRPEATAELFTPDGWIRTGDLAEERPDGAYRLIGRLKEMFKSGGYNVYPREIELVLETHPDVAMAAVISIPDPLYQEVGHAFILPHAERRAPSAESLELHCRAQLANYKVPKRFTITPEFPMLPIGKVDKQALKLMAR